MGELASRMNQKTAVSEWKEKVKRRRSRKKSSSQQHNKCIGQRKSASRAHTLNFNYNFISLTLSFSLMLKHTHSSETLLLWVCCCCHSWFFPSFIYFSSSSLVSALSISGSLENFRSAFFSGWIEFYFVLSGALGDSGHDSIFDTIPWNGSNYRRNNVKKKCDDNKANFKDPMRTRRNKIVQFWGRHILDGFFLWIEGEEVGVLAQHVILINFFNVFKPCPGLIMERYHGWIRNDLPCWPCLVSVGRWASGNTEHESS